MIDTYFTARVFDLITRIGANPGKNDKQSMLKAHGFEGDELDAFKNILLLCYSPRYRFGMSYVSPPVNVGVETDIAPFFALAEDLNSRNVTGDAAVNAVKAMLEKVTADTGELIRRVIHKDMRAGFGASTINKVFPKLIPEHAYMRCSLPKEVKFDKWEWDRGVFAQLKSDGTFQSATIVGGVVTIESRSGEIMPNESVADIVEVLLATGLDNFRMEGELTVVRLSTGETLPRGEGNGIINSVRQGGDIDAGLGIQYTVWDCISLADGTRDESEYETRFAALSKLFNVASSPVALAETERVHSLAAAWGVFQRYVKMGLEGAIIKRPTMPWVDGTSKNQAKLKTEFQAEYEITGFIEGKKGKKTENTFGALTYKSKDGVVRGSVSGIKDDIRDKIDADRESYIGGIITIEANALTQNRNEPDHWALSHPRFIEVRTDKTEADDYPRIRAQFENSFKVC